MKDKGFSYRNKVQQYHGEGRESIIVMGKPFKVIENLSAPTKESRRRLKKDNMRNTMVFLVENTTHLSAFPRHFALKRSIFAIDQVAEAHHEIEMLSRIQDKNIVRSYHCEVSRHEGTLGVSVCTEYCSNNLWKRIRSGSVSGAGTRLSESEIAHVLLGVTSALGYLHAQQPPIAYRAVHPENILISNKNTGPAMYKLCNFSFATTEAFQCDNREEAAIVIKDTEKYNTLAFVAPEMADPFARKRIDEQVDMWSLGVLLYSMLYMNLPFEPTLTSLSKNPRYTIPRNSNYSGCFQTILKHLLDPDPQSRWNVFALTNFLRFDEDFCRHLGTFCFSHTEYPEGWEEQTVHTVGRPAPEKNPPVTYGEGAPPVARVSDAQNKKTTGGAAAASSESGTRQTAPPPSSSSAPASGVESDPGFQKALDLLMSTGDIDDPRIAPYKAAIIRQQNAAWSSATGGGDSGPEPPAPTSPPPPQRHDSLEDLFGGPPQAPPPSAHVDPLADPFGAFNATATDVNNKNNTARDTFSADDLFAPAPAPPPPPPGAVPHAMAAMPFGGMPYGVGVPVANPQMMMAGYPPPPPPPAAGSNMTFGGGAAANPAVVDFLAPVPGMVGATINNSNNNNNNNNNNNKTASSKEGAVPGSKKDPFADLLF